MPWLYRLQQRLSITRNEGLAVLTLTFLFVVGVTVRHVQKQQLPPLEADSLLARARADSIAPPNRTPSPTPERPINVNEADGRTLQALPGIGPSLSKRIVEYRSSARPFQTVQELQRVRGIGPKTLADLRPLVTVVPVDTAR